MTAADETKADLRNLTESEFQECYSANPNQTDKGNECIQKLIEDSPFFI